MPQRVLLRSLPREIMHFELKYWFTVNEIFVHEILLSKHA